MLESHFQFPSHHININEQNGHVIILQTLSGLVFLATLFFLNFTSRVIFSPLLPVIEHELEIVHAQSGSLFLFISIGYFFSVLSSGFVSARINHKRTIILSSVALGLALFVLGECSTLFTLRLGLLGVGLGAGLYFPSGLATISYLVPSHYLSRGMAIHELAPNIGFVAAPLLCDLFLGVLPWRQGLGILGVCIMIGGLAYGLSSHGSLVKGKALDVSAMLVFFRLPMFWAMVVLFSLAICSTLGIYSMAPLFLVNDLGMESGKANNLLALSRIGSILMPLVGGWFGDKFGKLRVMAIVLLVTGLLTASMVMVANGFWLVTLVMAQPLFAVCFFPLCVSIVFASIKMVNSIFLRGLWLHYSSYAGGGERRSSAIGTLRSSMDKINCQDCEAPAQRARSLLFILSMLAVNLW